MKRTTPPLFGRRERDLHCHRCSKEVWRDIKAALGDPECELRSRNLAGRVP